MFELEDEFLVELELLLAKYDIDRKLNYPDATELTTIIKHFIYMLARLAKLSTKE